MKAQNDRNIKIKKKNPGTMFNKEEFRATVKN